MDEPGHTLIFLGRLAPLWMGLFDEANKDAQVRKTLLSRAEIGDGLGEELGVAPHLAVNNFSIVLHGKR